MVRLEDIRLVADFTLHLANRNAYAKKSHNMFDFVGLMLSRVCGGNCIFCPISKLQRQFTTAGKERFMALEVADKLVADLSRMSFNGWVNLGENGDAFLNPKFKDIVATINQNLPSARIALYTNMALIDESVSAFLMEQNLSLLVVNIDGSTKETYEYAKPGLKHEVVKSNLLDFISIRDSTRGKCRIVIQMIPPKRYMDLRTNTKVSIRYDVSDIVEFWKPRLSKNDSLQEVKYFWNWNNGPSDQIRKKSCPMVPSLLTSCYVSAEGDVYACCLDALPRLTFGSILEDPIGKIWNGNRRKEAVRHIVYKDFEKVGEPCAHCHEKNDFLSSYLNYLRCHLILGSRRFLRRFT